jgi:hypothetical protein
MQAMFVTHTRYGASTAFSGWAYGPTELMADLGHPQTHVPFADGLKRKRIFHSAAVMRRIELSTT